METTLAVLSVWLLVNAVLLLGFVLRGGLLRPARTFPTVTVPTQRAALDATARPRTTSSADA